MSTPDDPFAPPPEGGTPPPNPANPSQPGYGQAPSGGQPYGQPTYGQPSPGGQPPLDQNPYSQSPPVQQYGQAPYPAPGAYPPPKKTNGMAIAALVCSLAAFVTCISAPVGIVLGVIALSQIKKTGEDGRGLALAGVWIGAIFTALAIIGIAVVVALGV